MLVNTQTPRTRTNSTPNPTTQVPPVSVPRRVTRRMGHLVLIINKPFKVGPFLAETVYATRFFLLITLFVGRGCPLIKNRAEITGWHKQSQVFQALTPVLSHVQQHTLIMETKENNSSASEWASAYSLQEKADLLL